MCASHRILISGDNHEILATLNTTIWYFVLFLDNVCLIPSLCFRMILRAEVNCYFLAEENKLLLVYMIANGKHISLAINIAAKVTWLVFRNSWILTFVKLFLWSTVIVWGVQNHSLWYTIRITAFIGRDMHIIFFTWILYTVQCAWYNVRVQ